jgi:tetratricopeptide (TPR) repeat protein
MNNVKYTSTKPAISKEQPGVLFHFIKWLLIILIIFFSLKLLFKPFFGNWSINYVKKGDVYLQEGKFLSAKLAYNKALILNKKNAEANAHRKFAIDAQSDISSLREFYVEKNNTLKLELFQEIDDLPSDSISSALKAKEMIEKEEYQLAIEAAKKSAEINPDYEDGWLYLGIANLKCADNLEISKEQKDAYLAEAKRCFERVLSISPDNDNAKSYIETIR